jgi:hypothetical protein
METLAKISTLSRTLITSEIAFSIEPEQNWFHSSQGLRELVSDIITHTDNDCEPALVLA